jgi:hypothetical protein
LQNDRSQYEKAVEDVLSQMPNNKSIHYAHHYLLEADPYHFYALAKKIVETGKLSDQIKNARYFDPLRQTPIGFWTPVQWHSYAGVFCYHVLQKIVADIPLMEACGYFPLLMLVFVVCAFYLLCETMNFRLFSFFLGGLTLVLAPVFLQRSSFGWFDNDIYNLLFPAILLTLTLKAYESSRKKTIIYGIVIGVLSGVYSYFWVGWPFIFLLIVFVTILMMICQKLLKTVLVNSGIHFLGSYLLTLIFFGIFFSSPSVMFEYFSRGFSFIGKFQANEQDLWPNIFLTVGEAHSLTLNRLIHLSGNKITFSYALFGITVVGIARWIRSSRKEFLKWLFWVGMILPVSILALRTERFSLLVVLPLTIFVCFSLDALLSAFDFFLSRFKMTKIKACGFKAFVGVLLFLSLFPLQVLFAHALALNSKPIMNDVWYDTLQYLKKNTPEDAIIQSWWPPGYFIMSVAERRVFTDGGTQHHPEGYWQARLFMSTSHQETLNILRMLNSGGNGAVNYLIEKGYQLYEAMEFVDRMLLLDLPQMKEQCIARLDSEKCGEFLNLMVGPKAEAPTYFYIYNEMVEKNIGISLFARWNFKKAYIATKNSGGSSKRNSYIDEMIAMSGGVLRYETETKGEVRKDGTVLFPNGITFDLASTQVYLNRPQNNVQGVLKDVVYYDGKSFVEKTNEKGLNIGTFIYKKNSEYFSVIADKALSSSLLFRLYYLDGGSEKTFELVNEESNDTAETHIKVFKVNW